MLDTSNIDMYIGHRHVIYNGILGSFSEVYLHLV